MSLESERLKREVEEFERPDVKQDEAEEIKGYNMVEGDYKLIVKILEASELVSKNDNYFLFEAEKSYCDAFVEIRANGQSKRTEVRPGTNNPIFDSKFNLFFKALTIDQLRNLDIEILVVDKKSLLLRDAVIGHCIFDWTSIYFNRNHEFYNTWFALADPINENEGVTGYVLASITLLGPDDKQAIHDSSYIKSPLSTMEAIVADKKVTLVEYLLEVCVYRAEGLAPYNILDYDIRAYVVLKFAGSKVNSKICKSKNPEWNESLQVATFIPNKCKYVFLEVWNYNRLARDELIGVAVLDFADFYEQNKANGSEPCYANIYGPPLKGKDWSKFQATNMVLYGNKLGSHFIGRLLYKMSGTPTVNPRTAALPLKFQFPHNPAPVVPQKSYILVVDILEGFELPTKFKTCMVHVMVGPYLLKSTLRPNQGAVRWFQSLEEKKLNFPVDIGQVPDIILYLAGGQNQHQRLSFSRLRAADYLITVRDELKLKEKSITMREDSSLNLLDEIDSAGFIRARIGLFSTSPPTRQLMNAADFRVGRYKLILLLYVGRGISPKNQTGTSDPYVLFKCGGQKACSSVVAQTLNPNWFEVKEMAVELESRDTQFQKPLLLTLLDEQKGRDPNFIGKTMIPIKWGKGQLRKYRSRSGKSTSVLFRKPAIEKLRDNEGEVKGRVMLSFMVVPEEDAHLVERFQIKQKYHRRQLQIFVLGLRNVEAEHNGTAIKSVSLKFKYTRLRNKDDTADSSLLDEKNFEQVEFQPFSPQPIKNQATVLLRLFEEPNLVVSPKKVFGPILEVFLSECSGFKREMLGYQFVNLLDVLPRLAFGAGKGNRPDLLDQIEEESNEDEAIPDVEQLKRDIKELHREDREKEEEEELMKQHLRINPAFDPEKHSAARRGLDQELDIPNEFNTNYDLIDKKKLQQYDLNSQERYSSQQDSFELMALAENFDDSLFDEEIVHELERKRDAELGKPQKQRNSNYDMSSISQEVPRQPVVEDYSSSSLIQLSQRIKRQQKKDRQDSVNSALNFKLKQELVRKKLDASRIESQGYSVIKQKNMTLLAEEIYEVDNDYSLGEEQHKMLKFKDIEKYRRAEQKMESDAQVIENSRKVGLNKLTLFFFGQGKTREIESYEQYDSDPEEELDLTPKWYSCRKTVNFDLEEKLKVNKLHSIDLRSGKDSRVMQRVATLKCVFLSYEDKARAKKKEAYYQKVLKERTFIVRVYILKGKSLISEDKEKPTTFLKLGINEKMVDLKDRTTVKEDVNPAYFISQDIQVQLPGPSLYRIEVHEAKGLLAGDSLLGYTELDLENRYLTKKWHFFEHKPIELRNLYNTYGTGCQGRLETWFQIIELKYWKNYPPIKISAPPYDPYELRVIVWECQAYEISEDREVADLYVRGSVGTQQSKVTDTHWRSKGKGNFNWRWKFKANYPPKPEELYTDQLTVQLWDLNVLGHNTIIGETRININGVHRIIEKACKRNQAVDGKCKIKERGGEITNKLWFNVYGRKRDDFGRLVPTGKVRLSFRLMPESAAEKQQNGEGRTDPNMHPILPEPEGRLSFDFFHPLQFLKSLIGDEAYSSLCCKIICLVVLFLALFLGYSIFGSAIGNLLTK